MGFFGKNEDNAMAAAVEAANQEEENMEPQRGRRKPRKCDHFKTRPFGNGR